MGELVMYFWDNNSYPYYSKGPFYCGMNVVLNIPQFSFRLNGPTSTSVHIEVAMRFGGVEGMLIQLNNDEGYHERRERHIDCSWLSDFPEESERLWMGGRRPLKLETVRVVETQKNYQRFLRAFHLFDLMLCGDWDHQKVSKTDVRIVGGAVSKYLGIGNNGYHSFVNDTFRHFCARKTQIILNLNYMEERVKNKDFVSLVMNELKRRWYLADWDDDTNLFKPVLFELFGNVQEMVIDATGNYVFNLERLPQYAFPVSLKKMVIKGMWLHKASSAAFIKNKGWRVAFKNNKKLVFVR